MLVFASNDPHAPWDRGPKYDPAVLTVPKYLHDNSATRKALASSYGEISRLDEQVGVLLKLLDESKQVDNTSKAARRLDAAARGQRARDRVAG